MKLPGKTTDRLNFFWDKKEQSFTRQQERIVTDKNTKRDVEEYFKFLSDIEPGSVLPERDTLADKQFFL